MAIATSSDLLRVQADGFTLVPGVVNAVQLEQLRTALDAAESSTIRRRGTVYARRNLLAEIPEVSRLATSDSISELVSTISGSQGQVVRALLFDKVPQANWHVGWHQDLIIPVRERIEVAGFGPWSVKAGQPHVKPPIKILQQMLTLRVHLDDCGEDNGPLRVLPGSHRLGEIDPHGVNEILRTTAAVTCTGSAGTVLAMRPLLLHASSPSLTPEHRRVIHLEYAVEALPDGLQWPKPPQE